MLRIEETARCLRSIPKVTVLEQAPLAAYTRFGIGGPADILAETADPEAFVEALRVIRPSGAPFVVIGGGTNLIVADEGFRGVVLRLTAGRITADGGRVVAQSGAVLQGLVDFTVGRGLKGLETLAGIPGWVGGAVYGNAGAYGHSISERISAVTFIDGERLRTVSNEVCQFRYRGSLFKRYKDWIIVSAELSLETAGRDELRRVSDEIVTVRNRKFPPSMKCAGSIFKNLLSAELPPALAASVPAAAVREGKVPAAYFLERVGAKGIALGQIRVAGYHANLVYNEGGGTAADLRTLVEMLKRRVWERFHLALEEEVQYVGF